MNPQQRDHLEQRVILVAPTSKDASLLESLLQRAGVTCTICAGLAQVCEELKLGAGALILPEEIIAQENSACLKDWLHSQPSWSELPLLVVARPGADSAAVALAMDQLGNVTVLERPTRIASLVSAVRTALRARQRQYQIREHLDELRDANRLKDEFLAILAHELRNPLAPIRNSLHILQLTIAGDSNVQRVFEMLERQVNHMVRLVDDLLEVSRINRGQFELRKEPIEVAAIVRSAVETSMPLIEEAHHRLAISVPAEPLLVDGDPVRLAQVLANLLNNAAKYTDSGGQIWLSAQSEGGDVVISVRDNGRGIPSAMLPRVFDLFTQIRHETHRTQGGLGIGLALVKTLVEMHGGSIQALSAGAGQGSDFIIRLPLRTQPPEQSPAGTLQSAAAVFAARRILVVDDNMDSARSLGMLLKLFGAQTRVVFGGQEALEEVASFQPEVVILDLGMPGMDGFEVARQIRGQPEFHAVKLIALTGWGQEDDRRRTQAAGFDGHLTKPVHADTLKNLVLALDAPDGA